MTSQPAVAVGRPKLATHAVVAHEQTRRVILFLERQQSWIVGAPMAGLERPIRKIGFVPVRAGARRPILLGETPLRSSAIFTVRARTGSSGFFRECKEMYTISILVHEVHVPAI